MARPQRRWTAIFAVLALLFSQLALAAYVCPSPGSAVDSAAMAERMAAGESCDGMVDIAQPALCHSHCADAPQSADTVPVPVPTGPVLLQVWPLPMALLLAADAQAPARRAAEAAPRPPPEPLFLSTLRLRV